MKVTNLPWGYSHKPTPSWPNFKLFRPKLIPNWTKNGIFRGQKFDYFCKNFRKFFEVAEE